LCKNDKKILRIYGVYNIITLESQFEIYKCRLLGYFRLDPKVPSPAGVSVAFGIGSSLGVGFNRRPWHDTRGQGLARMYVFGVTDGSS
jgi:hypothetical protein